MIFAPGTATAGTLSDGGSLAPSLALTPGRPWSSLGFWRPRDDVRAVTVVGPVAGLRALWLRRGAHREGVPLTPTADGLRAALAPQHREGPWVYELVGVVPDGPLRGAVQLTAHTDAGSARYGVRLEPAVSDVRGSAFAAVAGPRAVQAEALAWWVEAFAPHLAVEAVWTDGGRARVRADARWWRSHAADGSLCEARVEREPHLAAALGMGEHGELACLHAHSPTAHRWAVEDFVTRFEGAALQCLAWRDTAPMPLGALTPWERARLPNARPEDPRWLSEHPRAQAPVAWVRRAWRGVPTVRS